MTVSQHIRNIQAHQTATCYYFAGTPIISFEGEFYTYKEFYEAFPIHAETVEPESEFKVGNPNKTYEWSTL